MDGSVPNSSRSACNARTAFLSSHSSHARFNEDTQHTWKKWLKERDEFFKLTAYLFFPTDSNHMNALLWYKSLSDNWAPALRSRDQEWTLLLPKPAWIQTLKHAATMKHAAQPASSQSGSTYTTNHHTLTRDAISGRSLGPLFPLTRDDNSIWQQNQG